MPGPSSLRLPPASSSSPDPTPLAFLEEGCAYALSKLEGECPFSASTSSSSDDPGKEGGEVKGKGDGRVCAEGGWHKLVGWRDTMNRHLGGRGLQIPVSSAAS
jgi:hypothetical protein